MDRLREHFEALGLANVATFIASGNVIFDANDDDPTALEVRIEAHLAGALGYEVDTFLRTLTELDAVARSEAVAVGASGGWMPHVIFLRNPPGEKSPGVFAILRPTATVSWSREEKSTGSGAGR